jgi:hypothetical protein
MMDSFYLLFVQNKVQNDWLKSMRPNQALPEGVPSGQADGMS